MSTRNNDLLIKINESFDLDLVEHLDADRDAIYRWRIHLFLDESGTPIAHKDLALGRRDRVRLFVTMGFTSLVIAFAAHSILIGAFYLVTRYLQGS